MEYELKKRRRRNRWILLAVVVLVGLIPLVLTFLWSKPKPAEEPGHAACRSLVKHSGSFTSSELKKYSDQFGQTQDNELKAAGSEWVITEITSDSQFVRDTRLVLLSQQCERIGVKS